MHRTFLVYRSVITFTALTALLCGQEPETKNTVGAAAISAALAAESETWQLFLSANGGDWTSRWCAATETPRLAFGDGVPLAEWRENSLPEARVQAQRFLRQHSELLGLGDSEFRETIGSRMGRTWCLVYDQYYRGLPVIDGRADVRVHMVGRIPAFGSTAFRIPNGFVTVPQLSELAARQIAWQTLGVVPPAVEQPGGPRQPRLVIWGDVDAAALAPVHLAWEIPVSAVDAQGLGPIGRYFIDAQNGTVLHYTNDKHECGAANCRLHLAAELRRDPKQPMPPSTGTVMAWTRLGTSATASLTNVPLANVEVSISGVGTVITDQNGQFTANIGSNTSVTIDLDGTHTQLISGSSQPTVTQTLIAGGSTTFQFLSSGASTNQAAHTTTYYWVDRVNEWCRSLLGNSSELNTADNIQPTVNIASTCNAYYTNNTINFYQAGGGCNNTAFSSVVLHEWGHGIDARYGGISQTNGLSEGWGDIVSMYLLDDAIVGEDFTTGGGIIRTGTSTRQYPTGSGVHAQGESWMGFAWKLRERLEVTQGTRAQAIAISNDIVISSLAADATNQADAVVEVFVADDDDGNLGNGTPHSAELIHACNLHSLPYPGGGPGGPTNDGCSNAISVGNGISGPFTSAGAATSSPSWPCANGGADVWFRYVASSAGTLTVTTCNQATWDTALQVFAGDCSGLTSLGCNDDACSLRSTVSVSVQPGVHHIRVGGYNSATGSFSLDVTGPTGSPATTTPYGDGCYRGSKAFYELFSSSAAFDLTGVAMRLIKAGDFYIAVPGGGYVAPSGSATTLSLTDDDDTSVSLSGSFPYPGGSTSSLVVCSNGFVSAGAGNGTAYSPVVATWLGSSQPRWGSWHDYNSSASGSGGIRFEQIGNIAYVTWDGVYDFGTANASTWQLQFDLSSGDVTYAWQSMSGTGNGHIVGYAHVAPNDDLGSMDISAALPGTFRTSADNAQPLALASTLPQLGGTLTFTTTNYPTGSPLGIQVLSFVQHNPGLDLSSAGMPGCFRFTDTEVTAIMLPSGGQSSFSVPIPNNPTYIGLPINGQSYAVAIGANATGIVSSNGVGTVVGL